MNDHEYTDAEGLAIVGIFNIDTVEIEVTNNGAIKLYLTLNRTFPNCITHLKFFEALSLHAYFVQGLDNPLDFITSEQWEMVKDSAQKYLNNKVFL